MNQPLKINLTEELLELENFIIHRSCDIEQWFRSQWLENQAPFYEPLISRIQALN